MSNDRCKPPCAACGDIAAVQCGVAGGPRDRFGVCATCWAWLPDNVRWGIDRYEREAKAPYRRAPASTIYAALAGYYDAAEAYWFPALSDGTTETLCHHLDALGLR